MRLVLTAILAALMLAPAAAASPLPALPTVLSFGHARVEPARQPAAATQGSQAIVRSIGSGLNLHADFGSGLGDGAPIGIPVTVVGGSEPKSSVDFLYEVGLPRRGHVPAAAMVAVALTGGAGCSARPSA